MFVPSRSPSATRSVLLLGCVLAACACTDAPSKGGPGARCVRLAQCLPGLACVEGMCSADLTALAEAGVVPVLPDAAVPADPDDPPSP